MTESKMLIIGLDGATFSLLDPLMAKGQLPHLTRLQERAFRAVLRSTMPPVTAPAWTSFLTGVNPGQHGILHFLNFQADSQPTLMSQATEIFPGGFSLINARSIQLPTLWQLLSDQGKQVGAINVPMTYPPSPVNGFMIAGMPIPPNASNYTYPPELIQMLPDYQIDLELHEREFAFDPHRFIRRLSEVLARRLETSLYLIRTQPWDLFMVVLTETDRAQHRFWHWLDPDDPLYMSSEAQLLRPSLEAFYGQVDAAVGALLQEAGLDCTVILMSDHGFGPVYDRNLYRRVLEQQLGLRRGVGKSYLLQLRTLLERTVGLNREKLYQLMGRWMPRAVLEKLERQVHEQERRTWQTMPAYIVPLLEHIGGIFVRDSTPEFVESLITRLLTVRDPQTQQVVIQAVYRREEIYTGPHVAEFPHLIFELTPGYVLRGGIGPHGALVGPRHGDLEKQGTHRPDGILLLAGPPILAGAATQMYHLEDLLPTILYLFDLPIPVNLNGHVIGEALTPEWASRPVRYAPPTPNREAPSQRLWESREEEELIARHLRGIGYLS
jgi:predicted AlkP superfamily phosphohydrolase/phosphomutase